MRYLLLALIPLLFTGCVVRAPYARHVEPVIYYEPSYPVVYGESRTVYKKQSNGHGHAYGHHKEYRH
ncbi:hypothetical protein WCX49_07575 [Sulfurimonas sp. HSL-1656]|uniref:hypothetical protein n=1 Tax=Thiomicrolovo subterrani TaxID=3131934 RepID=UPI0031F8720F